MKLYKQCLPVLVYSHVRKRFSFDWKLIAFIFRFWDSFVIVNFFLQHCFFLETFGFNCVYGAENISTYTYKICISRNYKIIHAHKRLEKRIRQLAFR